MRQAPAVRTREQRSFRSLARATRSFSHHRVSCPPAGWIRAAHQGGTKILGTLIFEHGAGRFDIVELVAPSSSGSSTAAPAFERLSTRYADSLVDLALERGIDGWLVNVEVELGGEGATGDQKRAHARALIAWLRYFSGEMRRRVPGGEVMWCVLLLSRRGGRGSRTVIRAGTTP